MDARTRWGTTIGVMAACLAVALLADGRLVIGGALIIAGAAALVPTLGRGAAWPRWLPAALAAGHIVVAGLAVSGVDGCGHGWVPGALQYVWLNYLSATRVLVPLLLAVASAAIVRHDRSAGAWGIAVSLGFYAYDSATLDAAFCGLAE